ncbi:MAG TPA: hypothetical protein DCY41_04505 [Opitutae bacterium]|nr:hypothetical protein [Opitutae bacterium]
MAAMSDESRKKTTPDDDRNLVIVDEDFAHADSEDRLWLFWERNRERIIGSTLAIFIGLVCWFAVDAWLDSQREALREEYASLKDDAGRAAFASAHPGETLSVVALLEIADGLHEAGKPSLAAYDVAATAAESAPNDKTVQSLGWRARLYAALQAQEAGAPDAIARLTRVAESTTAPDALRGPALLALARGAIAKSDYTAARNWLDKMDRQLGPNHPWREDQRALISSEPSLRPSAARGQ